MMTYNMRKLLFVLIGLMLLIFIGCAPNNISNVKDDEVSQNTENAKSITDDEKTAENFIKSQEYTIVAQKGEIQKYTLEKSKLYGGTKTIPYEQIWSVQKVDPDKYFGKEIVVYGFTVKNHPMEICDRNAKNGVNLYIMLSDGIVIGGYSFPNADVVGAYSSIDGKTLEEVKGVSRDYSQEKQSY